MIPAVFAALVLLGVVAVVATLYAFASRGRRISFGLGELAPIRSLRRVVRTSNARGED